MPIASKTRETVYSYRSIAELKSYLLKLVSSVYGWTQNGYSTFTCYVECYWL